MLRRFFEAIRVVPSSNQVRGRAEVVEDVLYGLNSNSDSEAVQAVAQLTSALCSNQCAGVVDAGFFIFFKVRNGEGDFQIFHKRLTVRERKVINANPTVLSDPYQILEKLEGAVGLEHQRAEELRAISRAGNASE